MARDRKVCDPSHLRRNLRCNTAGSLRLAKGAVRYWLHTSSEALRVSPSR